MVRWAYITAAFIALAAWVSAQGPVPAAPLSPEDKLRLLKANSTLIDNLVTDGIKLSAETKPVERADRCRNASRSLVNEIKLAATAEDAERVAVLTGLFHDFVREALVPLLEGARRTVPPQSPDGKKLRELSKMAADDLSDLKEAATSTAKLSNNPRVKDAVKQLDELTDQLK